MRTPHCLNRGRKRAVLEMPMQAKWFNFLALFTSTGTLLCCALPALLATIAGGAAVGALVTTFPWLIPLSRYKGWLFLMAGGLIVISGILTLWPRSKVVCAVTGGKGCEVAGRWTRAVFWTAVVVYLIGFTFAYALVPILRGLEG